MSRLIDADALIYRVMGNGLKPITEQIFRKLIDDEPTIDAVEVVRCKECVWNDGKGHCKLRYGSLGVFDDVSCDDYCNYGERKEDE